MYTVGNIFLQLLFDIVDPGIDVDRLLNGPTNDVWIDPWLEHLRNASVEYHLNARLTGINCDDETTVSVTIEKDRRTINISGDYYICALPVEVMAAFISDQKMFIPIISIPILFLKMVPMIRLRKQSATSSRCWSISSTPGAWGRKLIRGYRICF